MAGLAPIVRLIARWCDSKGARQSGGIGPSVERPERRAEASCKGVECGTRSQRHYLAPPGGTAGRLNALFGEQDRKSFLLRSVHIEASPL